MSFGVSIGDFISVLTLANKLRRDFVGAPSQFNSISREVRGLAIILQDVDVQLLGHDTNDQQQNQLGQISHSCVILLNELQNALEKYKLVEYSGTSIHKKARGIWKRIVWEPEDISELRGRLMSNVILLQSFLSAISSQTMAATKQTLEQLNYRQEGNEKSCILDWLSAVDYTLQQSDLLGRRQGGTGKWLLDSQEYKHWLRTRRGTLFCPGMPGAGKTICSAILVDDLTTRFEDTPDVGIAYIYCNFNRQDEQTAQELLSSLLKQLSQKKTSVPDAVKDLYKRYKTASTRPRFDEISKALHSVVSTYSDVFIVIDALDECESTCRTRVLDELNKLRAGPGANVFATSRPTEINDLFEGGSVLEIQAQEDDVRRYLAGNMFRLPGFVSRNTALQEEIMTAISRHVQGMFLLAQLYFESLIGRRSPKSTRTALKEFSKGFNDYAYDKAYDDAMSRIQGQLREQTDLAIQTLSWLTCARRPLTSLELQHALAIEEGESSLDEENIPEIEDILTVCAGLVTVENESGIIRLVHYTTQEYLERKKDMLFPSAETEISMLCVTYISFDTFGSGICESDEAFEERLESHPFYRYAVRHWGDHVRATKDLDPDVIGFLEDQPKVDASEQAFQVGHSISKDWSQKFSRNVTGLHLAAYNGIEGAVSYFLQHGQPVDMCHNGGRTALQWAVSGGHLNVTRLLITHGADLKGNGNLNCDPLASAATRGHEDIVRLLLERGVDVDTPCGWDGSALVATCDKGRLNIAEILLSRGADINAESEILGTPLEAAAMGGHWELVAFLLEKGANPNSQGDEIDTALQAASASGREDVVQILLNHHVDVNQREGVALVAACRNGHEQVVRMLLDNGADPNARNGGHSSALVAASMNGNQRILHMLLESGANINAESYLGPALVAAAKMGNGHIVKVLLENGAEIHGRGKVQGCALHAAASRGDSQIVQMLLDRGADSTIRAGVYKTPLRAALMGGHQEVAALLKRQGQQLRV
ncbi:hypothetical protein DTO027I6_2827 [Penicillium roqueforti]|nr:hypothetical protein CBS147337_3469 [Penicillium roqueforti]KAI2672158.1 hypothetical protein CBS147355_8310 [Penicillium roqueforti]KAI3141885.1 hypothetical protein CBS147326_1972 [Penicillium roqueforti]KAI3172005.1 hypothetical protein CBS147317_1434 [Penicillium roqueforti]KAI3215223.1 hypothetical protein DTO027I6_2827 [Penicillium roqueforti]